MTASDKWRFDKDDEIGTTGYVVNKRLGRGAVAEAYLVSRSGQEYVLKVSVNDGDKSLRDCLIKTLSVHGWHGFH